MPPLSRRSRRAVRPRSQRHGPAASSSAPLVADGPRAPLPLHSCPAGAKAGRPLGGRATALQNAAGERKERDAERAALLTLRKASADPELRALKFYCRDQFTVSNLRVMVFEYFDLAGDEPIRWSFDVLGADGRSVTARYTLGSSKITNAVAREQKLLKPGQRLFHLDGLTNGGTTQQLFELYLGEPDYDRVKAAVLEILAGRRKPRAETQRTGP